MAASVRRPAAGGPAAPAAAPGLGGEPVPARRRAGRGRVPAALDAAAAAVSLLGIPSARGAPASSSSAAGRHTFLAGNLNRACYY